MELTSLLVLSILALGGLALAGWLWFTRRAAQPDESLPTHWPLTARPVFSADERRVFRMLRESLPHHVILCKLPLVRFCQATDPERVTYWYDLLGATHVGFAICSASGRVLAAIDLDSERNPSSRNMQIKDAVLAACRVRYLRCAMDRLPTEADVRSLLQQRTVAPSEAMQVPVATPSSEPTVLPDLHVARDSLARTVATRRAERTALWQDSKFQDSFFAPDSRSDATGNTLFGSYAAEHDPAPGKDPWPQPSTDSGDDVDIAGVVVDSSQAATNPHR